MQRFFFEQNMKKHQLLYNLVKEYKWAYIASVMFLLVHVFLRMMEPKILQFLIDSVLMHKSLAHQTWMDRALLWVVSQADNTRMQLLLLCLSFLLVAVVKGVSNLLSKTISIKASENSITKLRVRLFEHIQKLPLSAFATLNKGELIQRSTGDIETIRNFISLQIVELIRLLSIFLFAFIMLLLIDVKYALISVCLAPIIFISTYIFFKKEAKVWQTHEDEADKLTNIAQENLNGIRTVQAYHKQKDEIGRFNKQNDAKFSIGLKHVYLHTFFWPFSDVLTLTQINIFVILGGVFVLQGRLTLGELVAAYTYAGMIAWPLRQAGRVLSQMSMALVAIDRIEKIFECPEEENDGQAIQHIHGDIEFEDLSFRYAENLPFVLQNVSFKVKSGEKIAVMGESAAGKSSLMKLLLRFYDVQNGSIKIDRLNINQLNKESLRNRIGMVMQQSILFSMSIEGNIQYAKQTPHAAIYEAITDAGFGNLEEVFPQGLETEVGERGVSLSGGQKQRLSLARSLVKNPDVIILDDFTSALDNETERFVMNNLDKRMNQKTVFIITHRISTLKRVDKVLVLHKDGSMAYFGKPKEGIETCKFLTELNRIEQNLSIEIGIK